MPHNVGLPQPHAFHELRDHPHGLTHRVGALLRGLAKEALEAECVRLVAMLGQELHGRQPVVPRTQRGSNSIGLPRPKTS